MGIGAALPTAFKGVSSLVSGIGNLVGGGGSSAGLSEQEAALMEYEREQNILKNNSIGASSGTGIGTGTSYKDAASGIGAAVQGAGIVDQQLAAQQGVQQANLQALAQSAGFGTQSSNVNPTPNVSTGANTGSTGVSSAADQLAAGEIPV